MERLKVFSIFMFITAMVGLALLSLSCASHPPIVGKWVIIKGGSEGTACLGERGTEVEFFKEGTVRIGGWGADYEWLSGNQLKIELPLSTWPVYKVRWGKGRLILEHPDCIVELERVK